MRFIVSVLLFLSISGTAISQQKNKPSLMWKGFVSVGYANATSDNISNYYKGVIDLYNLRGIPISIQKKFGPMLSLNMGVLFTQLQRIWFGFVLGYEYSSAYSGYKDFAGLLKVKGDIRAYKLSLNLKATITELGRYPINLDIEPGIDYSSASIVQDLDFFNFPNYSYGTKWLVNSWGFCFQSTLGSTINFGKFSVSIDGGYLFLWNNVFNNSTREAVGKYNLNIGGPWNIGVSGFIFLVSADFNL